MLSSGRLRKNSRSNRHSLEIVRDILQIASVRTRKTRIMYQANLSYMQVQKYLHELLDTGLLIHESHSFYLITKKGQKFIELYHDYSKRRRQLKEQVAQSYRDKNLLEQMCSNNISNWKKMKSGKIRHSTLERDKRDF